MDKTTNQPTSPYQNKDRLCECWMCELSQNNGGTCPYTDKYQRHPEDLAPGALGLCKKLQGGKV